MRRPFFLCLLATLLGCLGAVDATADDPPPPAASSPAPQSTCEARDPAGCRSIERATLDEPPTAGALVWAQPAVAGTLEDDEGRSIGTPKIAIYEDGTVRRTPVLRNLRYLATAPRGLVVARLDAGSLARVRAEVAAVRAEDTRAFARPDLELRPDDTDLFVFPTGAACAQRTSSGMSCGADSLTRVRATVEAALAATEQKWRDARAGTVSLGRLLTVSGRWPLDEALAKDGFLDAGEEEQRLVAGGKLYRLSGGDFVSVEATIRIDDKTSVYVTRMSSVVLSDATLTADLLANTERYQGSRGEWLGIPVEESRFVAMKNREIAIVPATADSPERVYELYAIEQLDLTNDGAIALP